MSGLRAFWSSSVESIEIGNAPTFTVRKPTWMDEPRPHADGGREVLAPSAGGPARGSSGRRRADGSRPGRRPGRPSTISVRHGICMNNSTGGKGMWRKESDGQIRPKRAQHLGHQLELVVLYPYGGVGCGRPGGGFGEAPVDLDVAVPPVPVVDRPDDHVVVQRPQRRVGEALVVLGDFLGAQPNGHEPQALLDDRLPMGGVGAVVVLGMPGQPIQAP